MIRDAGLVLHGQAAVVALLPPHLGFGGVLDHQAVGEVPALQAPLRMLRLERGVARQAPDLGLGGLQHAALHREHEAERLAFLEADPVIGAGEAPVHREGIRRPVGFDHAAQGIDAVLRLVRRSADEQVPARLGAEQPVHVEGQDAVAEDAGRPCMQAGGAADVDGLGSAAAVPARTEGAGRQELPAMGIGNVERETAVGERVAGLVHPGSCRRRRPQRSAAFADRVEGQLHRPLQCSCGAGAIQVATARSGLIAFPMPLASAAHACPRKPPRRLPLAGATVNVRHSRVSETGMATAAQVQFPRAPSSAGISRRAISAAASFDSAGDVWMP